MKPKRKPDPALELLRKVYTAPVLTAFDLPKKRKTVFPYIRLSWRHWGVGLFFYWESHAKEVCISVGPNRGRHLQDLMSFV